MRNDLPPIPATVNGYPVLAHKPYSSADSEICEVILCRRGEDDYVTWGYNRECPGAFGGSYDMNRIEAAQEFHDRGTRGAKHSDYHVTDAATDAERFCLRAAWRA